MRLFLYLSGFFLIWFGLATTFAAAGQGKFLYAGGGLVLTSVGFVSLKESTEEF